VPVDHFVDRKEELLHFHDCLVYDRQPLTDAVLRGASTRNSCSISSLSIWRHADESETCVATHDSSEGER